MLHVMGKDFVQIDKQLKLGKRRTANLQTHWPEYWDFAVQQAKEQITSMVKRQIGTAELAGQRQRTPGRHRRGRTLGAAQARQADAGQFL